MSGAKAQQTYPIYVTSSLTPPYSLTLSDYSQSGSQRLVVTVMVRDVTVTNLPVRLSIKLETMTGVTVETIPTASVTPIYLTGGEGLVLFGEDLKDYFNINNLQFKGYSKEEYRRTGQLPEGFYRITVEVHHFATGRLISNQGMAMAWIALGKPPVLKTPDDRSELGQINGMPLTFSWLPLTVGTPNSGIQYTFEMWEMRIQGIDPNVVAASMPVFYSATQMNTSLVIQPAMLLLEPGMNYAWRVTASDVIGQVPFAQGGHSEVRTFTYQCHCDSVTNFYVDRQGQDVTFRWTPANNHTSFNVELNNPESDWSKSERVYDAKLHFISDPDKTYRARVQAICQGNEMNPSDFTAWQTVNIPAIKTQEEICPECECKDSGPEPPIANFTLRTDLQPGDTIQTRSGNNTFIIKSVIPQGNGVYKGQFLTWIKIWGVKFLCDYWDLKVNTDNHIVGMNFESVYDPQFVYIDSLANAIAGLISPPQPEVIELDFTIPENPEYHYDDETGTITVMDEAGSPHEIKLPKNDDGTVDLPVAIVDRDENIYKVTEDDEGNIKVEKVTQEELGDSGSETETGAACGCLQDKFRGFFNGDCKTIFNLLEEIKTAYNDKKQVTLQKSSLLKGRIGIDSLCIPKLYFDMSWVQANEIKFDPSSYKITESATNSYGSGTKFWAIKYDDILEIKIPSEEADAEKKIRALAKWMFEDSGDSVNDEDIYLKIQWYSQFNQSLFENPCGCWPTNDCNGSKIAGNQCCNRAATKIMSNAGAKPENRLIIAQTNRACTDEKKQTILYDDNGIVANNTLFEQAVQIIDISLKEHKLPIMIGVQHPYKVKDKWYYKCGSPSNNPRATNHFIVIVGKGYDKTKKMWFYYFYEVVAGNVADGASKENKLWIDTNQHLIMGNVSIYKKENYYIVTDVRKNQGKIYNLNK